ncbi:TPA: hypothetical protein ACGOU9_001843 [Streptococcus suis]
MKKTVWNASLEESMNLVTDKYIKTSMDDVNQHGYKKKILGFFTMVLFIGLLSLIGSYIDKESGVLLFLKAELLFRIPLVLSLVFLLCYLMELRKVREYRVLSYYIFNRYMFLVMSCFILQLWLICAVGFAILWGSVLSIIVNVGIFSIVVSERLTSFIKKTEGALYQGQPSNNILYKFLEKFVAFSKRYGGGLVVLLLVSRFVFKNSFQSASGEDIYHNDFLRSLAMTFSVFFPILPFYFSVAIATSCIEGYYLEKYSEDYRQLSGYSVEDWYGKKSKRYKESLGK